MPQKHLIKAINILLFAVVIGTPLFYVPQSVYPYVLSKTLFFQGVVEILFFLWLALIISDKNYRPKSSPILRSLAVFLALLAFSALLGSDVGRSFWSTQERSLGVITIFHLAVLAVVISSLFKKINWKALLYSSMASSAAVCVLALMQLSVLNLLLVENVGSRPGSTFGNPTFLAGYLLFNVFVGFYLWFDLWRRKKDFSSGIFAWRAIFVAATTFLSAYVIFITQTRGDILGLGAAITVLLALFAIHPPESSIGLLKSRKFYAFITVFILLVGSTFWFTRSNPVWSKIPGLQRFRSVSLRDESLGPRLIAIKSAWQGFLEHPVLGWGWDNFNIVFNKYYDPRSLELNYQETRFDKPHNFILEYLVVGGVALLAAFLALIGAIFYEAVNIKDRLWGQIAIAAIAGYFVRNLFVFDTIGPLLMFYILTGITNGYYASERDGVSASAETPVKKELLGFLSIAAVIIAYLVNGLSLEASYHQFWGFRELVNAKSAEGVNQFRESIDTWSPYNSYFKRDYAATVTEAYFNNPGLIAKDDARAAIGAMEEVAREHPLDAYNHYALVDMYNQISDIDPEKYLPAAEREAKIALTLSPERQEVFFSLAKTKALEGDNKTALAILRHALDLDSKVPDAHFYYGLLAYVNQMPDVGYRELRTSMDMGRKWKNFNEPRVVANFFADSGHIKEAIDLYKKAIEMRPSDLESEIKLGVAYYITDQKDLARQEILDVMSKFDLKKSENYSSLAPILKDLNLLQ